MSASCAVRASCIPARGERVRTSAAQLEPRAIGERLHADLGKQLVDTAQLISGVTDAPLAA